MIQERESPILSPIDPAPTYPQKQSLLVESLPPKCGTRLLGMVREKRLRKVLALIESQPAACVRQLALEVGLSPAHLQRLFKRETGLYISRLLSEHRLERAVHLLSASNLQIKEIAYAAGYEHHSSFVRAFRRRFARSPKQYRLRGEESTKS